MGNSQYTPIPSNSSDDATPAAGWCKISKLTGIIALALVFVVGYFVVGMFFPEEEACNETRWPSFLSSQASTFTRRPTTTHEAFFSGWEKIDDAPCDPLLGEPWLYNGKRSIDSSVTLYFTPQVGEVPGVISAIEVDYYGYIEQTLVGTYFSEERTSDKDGTYHSLALALRDAKKHNLCDQEKPITNAHEKYIAISPYQVNKLVPIDTSQPELEANWAEGSCIQQMGYHWIQDINGGNDLTYEAEATVPIVPMYNSQDGSINGIFFLATAKKQVWAEDCPVPLPRFIKDNATKEKLMECFAKINFWDGGPGLTEENKSPLYMCSNFCGTECHFHGSGSNPGIYNTMHWFFKDVKTETCGFEEKHPPYCRSGQLPIMVKD